MGAQLAQEALSRGHRVTVVSGPVEEPLPKGARVIRVETAQEMEAALRKQASAANGIIMAAAVADFRAKRRNQKLTRQGRLTLRLEPVGDIIGRLPKRRGQLRAGFALESEKALERATEKLYAKQLDVLVAQQITGHGPFGRNRVRAWLISSQGMAGARSVCVKPLGRVSKQRVARELLDKLEQLWYGQPRQKA